MELDAAQALLRKAAASADGGDDHEGCASAPAGGGTDAGSTSSGSGGGGCGGGGHDHSHAHAHHGHAHGDGGELAGARCDAHSGSGGWAVLDKSAAKGAGAVRGEEEESARKEMAGVLEVLQRAKTACRVSEGACLLRGGRVAESTEALRKLLFEVTKKVGCGSKKGVVRELTRLEHVSYQF